MMFSMITGYQTGCIQLFDCVGNVGIIFVNLFLGSTEFLGLQTVEKQQRF